MKKQMLVELTQEWVRKHMYDEDLPVQVLKKVLIDNGVEIAKHKPYEITVIFEEKDDGKGNEEFLKKLISDVLNEKYSDMDAQNILTFTVEGLEDTPKEEKSSEKSEEKTDKSEAFSATSDGKLPPLGFGRSRAAASESAKTSVQSVMEEIDGLVGATEFKNLAKEIVKIAPQIKEKKTFDILKSRRYLFSIDDGCGLTCYLELLAKLYNAVGVASDMKPERTTEIKLNAPADEREDVYGRVLHDLDSMPMSSPRIICVDVSEYPTNPENDECKQFLRSLNKLSPNAIYVFRIPFVDKAVLERWRSAIADIMWVSTVSVPPFTATELRQHADTFAAKYGFKVASAAWQFFDERIAEEKSDGKFYGISTVENVMKEAIYSKQLDNAYKNRSNDVINAKDMKKLCAFTDDGSKSGWELLNELVGNTEVKEKVKEIIALIKSQRSDKSKQSPCIHMRFLGNPGTGKTTVARILGKILKEEGVLRVGRFYEYMSRDLCGRYVGQTSPKTSGICREAYGSVLFIEEAYSLFRGDKEGRDYGMEAIDTLIAEMENHRDDFVVILAGYTDEMEVLMQSNPGLAGRAPYSITFPNFTKDQLLNVFKSMVKNGNKFDEEIFQAAKEYFDSLSDEFVNAKEFGNGRFVRNLDERTVAKAAMRCQLDKRTDTVLTREDFSRACTDREFAVTATKKTRLGFHI